MSTGLWGIWITRVPAPKRGTVGAYWYMGPDYYADRVFLTAQEAESEAASLRTKGAPWTYEVRPYKPEVGT